MAAAGRGIGGRGVGRASRRFSGGRVWAVGPSMLVSPGEGRDAQAFEYGRLPAAGRRAAGVLGHSTGWRWGYGSGPRDPSVAIQVASTDIVLRGPGSSGSGARRAVGPRNTRQSESDGVAFCDGLAAAAGRGTVSPSKQTRKGTGVRQRAEGYLSAAAGVKAAARRLVRPRRRGAASALRPGYSGSRCGQPAHEHVLSPSRATRNFLSSSGGVGHQRSSNG